MADFLAAKTPAETVERRWQSNGAQSVSIAATGITATALVDGDEIVFTLSDGTAGQTAYIDVTVVADGETRINRIYVPIVATGHAASTVQDVVNFALRKITGISETPDAEQANDAVERLTDMLEVWRVTGADIGAPRPLSLSTVLYAPHSHLSAIKNNLIVSLSDIYGADALTASVIEAARRGLQLVKMANQPFAEAEYF